MDIGLALRQLRQQRGLTQEELAYRCELTKGFISQVERNLASPSIASLIDMLEVLGTNPSDFFREMKKEKMVYTPQDMFEKVDEETLHGSITWLVPNAQGNSMEPILLTLGPGGRSYTVGAGEWEEFGYVLSGTVDLVTAQDRQRIKAGCSFCVHPATDHYLVNSGKTRAQVLWVSTPPSF